MTAAVAVDDAEAEPPALVAVTTERMVWPTSALVSTYPLEVAPLMLAQLAPELSHWRHW